MGHLGRVLVTGGAGFIGSHTVDLLVHKGYQVRVLDNLQKRVHAHGAPPWLNTEAEFIQGDTAGHDDLARALSGTNFVIHLAAYQDYLTDFSNFVHTNAESTALIFELVVSDPKRYPLEKIVFASSQSVSGEGRYLCRRCAGLSKVPSIEEQTRVGVATFDLPARFVCTPEPRRLQQLERGQWEIRCPRCDDAMQPLLIDEATVSPGTAYGISKYAAELLADRLGKRYSIPTVCMRYTYVQGSRNSFYNAYSGVARRFALGILNGMAPVVYEDGCQLRDYVSVRDVARANVLAMEDERANYQILNVGGGRAVTVLEFAHLILKEFGSSQELVVRGEFRVGDTRHTVSDISKLAALGWQPRIPVEENIREYVAWMKQQRGTAQYLEEAEKFMHEQRVVRRSQRRN
jgi:dTDP-L-rhamnose 4-epimerase